MPQDPLEDLRKRLYKKEETFGARLRRPELTPRPEKISSFWKEENMPKPSRKPSNMKRWWIALGSFFVIAAIGGGLYFFIFLRAVSSRNIEIDISAPESIAGGDRASWEVLITNNNSRALESAEFIFEYPAGSKILDEGVRGLRSRKGLGRIGPGETVKLSFNAFVFGFEGEEKFVQAALEYRPEGSSAILSKEVDFTIRVSRAPVGISFDAPEEIRAGQEVEFKMNYVSNSESTLEGLIFELEAPPGFIFKKGIPEPEAGEKTWILGSLDPGEKGSIVVTGILSGGELEEKSFKASVGTRNNLGEFSVYGQGVRTLVLRRPFMEVDAKLGGADTYAARPGEILEIEISFRNNLTVPVQNVVIEGIFSGRGFDEKQIKVRDGAYRTSDKKAIWNASSAKILEKLDPGEGGTLKLQFGFFDSQQIKSSNDKEFKTSVNFEIRPGIVPSGFFGTDVTGEDLFEIKLISRLQLVRRGLYFSAPIPNSGPLPPKVGQETTFNVIWSLANSTNDLDGVTVKAVLPSYMNWKGATIPSGAPITFDSTSGEIVWRVGELKAGLGYISPAREIGFQVGFLPSPNQVGQTPELVSAVRVEGRDTFTDTFLQIEAPSLTLELEGDPKVELHHRTVVK